MHDDMVSIGGFTTLTDVGAAYDTIQASRGLGMALVNFLGVESIDFRVAVNKIGTGTQSWQLWNVTDGAQIGVIDDAASAGERVISTTINSGLPNGIKLLRVRAKSTVAADDPVYGGATLLLQRPAMSFERMGLADQLTFNAYGITRNIRDNANGYKAKVMAGVSVSAIAAEMVANAGQYIIRMGWFTTAVSNNLAAVTATLGDYGVALAGLAAFRDNIIAVSEHTQAATLTTGNQIDTEADYILANVPSYARLW